MSKLNDCHFMDYITNLEEFGFSKNESKVYIALLELGLTNAGPIVKKCGLHRQLVYQALENLERKGYVSEVVKNKRKFFQASSPNSILRHVEDLTEKAQTLSAELSKLQINAVDSVEIKTLYGQKGFASNLRDIVESAARTDKVMRILGSGKDEDFYRIIGDWYPSYLTLLKKYTIEKWLLAPINYAEDFKRKFATEPGNHLKLMNIGISSPTYTRMTPEMVSIEIYVQNRDAIVIQIRNRAIAQGYIENFNLLWAQTEEYRPN